jgi:hypothetical protein
MALLLTLTSPRTGAAAGVAVRPTRWHGTPDLPCVCMARLAVGPLRQVGGAF